MLIQDNKALADFCARLKNKPFITVDTEFLREKTYYPKLCLIQMAAEDVDAAAIDPLAEGLDLAPVIDLLNDESIVKVFHAARQDLEIFYQLSGKVPHPLFDTQVAAMVLGYGDQIGYHNLVQRVCNHPLDKGAQFTDWSRRPLSKKQMSYALDDVIYLRDVYQSLSDQLKTRGREHWVREEMAILENPGTYVQENDTAWERIKIKSTKPQVLAVLREVAAWREEEAKTRDLPRNFIFRDDVLSELAFQQPQTPEDLAKTRNLSKDFAHSKRGKTLLEAIARGRAVPKDARPEKERRERLDSDLVPALEMLKMLLRIAASENDVATRLIANTSDLEALAADDKADIPALRGWRREVFGNDALALKRGELGLSLKDGQVSKLSLAS